MGLVTGSAPLTRKSASQPETQFTAIGLATVDADIGTNVLLGA